MKTSLEFPLARWALCGVLLFMLLFGVAVPASAQDEFGFATITLYAPGAPAGAWVSVQWQDQTGAWRNVEGWQGRLDTSMAGTIGSTSGASSGNATDETTNTGVAFKQWAVYPQDYGRGPFRWVVSNQQGGTAWATSANFFLPDGNGAALATTVSPSAAGGPATPGAARADFATITLLVPGAPAGARVGIQWRGQNGAWNDVEGWQGALDMAAGSTTPSKTWGVYARDYGQGPFRWVVYSAPANTNIASTPAPSVLGTSQRFNLPSGDGANLTLTVLPKIAVTPADTLTEEMLAAPVTLGATTSTSGLNCTSGPCNSVISLSVPNAMAGSLVGVQWQDSFGLWHDVPSWQGSLIAPDSNSTPSQQWAISPELQGRGPFRWVIYNQMGDSVMGVTSGFMLPDRGGINLNLNVPADVSDIAG